MTRTESWTIKREEPQIRPEHRGDQLKPRSQLTRVGVWALPHPRFVTLGTSADH